MTVRAPDGRQATVPVEVKHRLDPKDVAPLAAQLKQMIGPNAPERPLVVAPYLSPRTKDLLVASGLSYATGGSMLSSISGGTPLATSSGTINFSLNSPAAAVDVMGVERNPWLDRRDQPLRSLQGPTAGRVVRALADFRPPYGVQALAERSKTSIASVSRVLSLLDTEALVTRASRGPVTDVRWVELVRRWTQDYSFSKANTVSTYLEPRGLPALLDKLQQTDLRYAITGSIAAARIAPITAPRLLTVYVDRPNPPVGSLSIEVGDDGTRRYSANSPASAPRTSTLHVHWDDEVRRYHANILDACARSLGLRLAERGANVVLAEPFNPVVFDRTQEIDGLRYAAPSQVAADLLTGPGRSPAEADALLQWMMENEDAWRQ